MSKTKNENIRCSFCGREKKDVNVLIAGITGHICEACISQANYNSTRRCWVKKTIKKSKLL